MTPWRSRDAAGSYAEGYLASLQRGRDVYLLFCLSMDGLMGTNYLEEDFNKLLDSFVIRGLLLIERTIERVRLALPLAGSVGWCAEI